MHHRPWYDKLELHHFAFEAASALYCLRLSTFPSTTERWPQRTLSLYWTRSSSVVLTSLMDSIELGSNRNRSEKLYSSIGSMASSQRSDSGRRPIFFFKVSKQVFISQHFKLWNEISKTNLQFRTSEENMLTYHRTHLAYSSLGCQSRLQYASRDFSCSFW